MVQIYVVACGLTVVLQTLFWLYKEIISARAVPGPFLARLTRGWYAWKVWQGSFHQVNIDLHKKYGMHAISGTHQSLEILSASPRADRRSSCKATSFAILRVGTASTTQTPSSSSMAWASRSQSRRGIQHGRAPASGRSSETRRFPDMRTVENSTRRPTP